jgi:hypothetical protein
LTKRCTDLFTANTASFMFVFDENGLTRSDGFLDHTTTKLGR